MNKQMKQHLEAVVTALVEQDNAAATTAFHEYLRMKSQAILVGEAAEEDDEEGADKKKGDEDESEETEEESKKDDEGDEDEGDEEGSSKKKINESDDSGVFIWSDEGERIIHITDLPSTTTKADMIALFKRSLPKRTLNIVLDLPAEGYVVSKDDQVKFKDLINGEMTAAEYISDLKQSF